MTDLTTDPDPATSPSGNGVPATQPIVLTRKDFASDQEVRWCPGCGDYSILAQTQKVMPDFGYPRGVGAVLLVQSDRVGGTQVDVQSYAAALQAAGASEVAVADDA